MKLSDLDFFGMKKGHGWKKLFRVANLSTFSFSCWLRPKTGGGMSKLVLAHGWAKCILEALYMSTIWRESTFMTEKSLKYEGALGIIICREYDLSFLLRNFDIKDHNPDVDIHNINDDQS